MKNNNVTVHDVPEVRISVSRHSCVLISILFICSLHFTSVNSSECLRLLGKHDSPEFTDGFSYTVLADELQASPCDTPVMTLKQPRLMLASASRAGGFK